MKIRNHFELRTSNLGFSPRLVFLFLLATPALVSAQFGPQEEFLPLRPARPEIPPTFWEQYGWWIALGGILLLALIGAGLWFVLRPRPPVLVTPEAQARLALEPLRQKPEDGVVLSQVSQVLRHYMAAAFNLPPGEFTTAEFCRALIPHEQVGPALSVPLTSFLRQCDERKFSPAGAGPALGAVAQALKLIEQAEARRAQWQPTAAPAVTQPAGTLQPSPSPTGGRT